MGQSLEKGMRYIAGDPPVLTEEDLVVERRGVVWNVDGTIRSCIFCDYASKKKEKKLLYEDDLVVAFAPPHSSAKQHILVVPHHRHISCIGNLFSSDAHVLDRMRSVAGDLLKKNGANLRNTQFSFHVPPWNSIDHVHMHALELPFTSFFSRTKYSEGKPWCVSYAFLREWVAANNDVPDDEPDASFALAVKEAKLTDGDETKEALGDEEKTAERPVANKA